MRLSIKVWLDPLVGFVSSRLLSLLQVSQGYRHTLLNHWLGLHWNSSHNDKVIALLDLKEPDAKPSQSWLLAFLPLYALLKDVDKLFQCLHPADLLVFTLTRHCWNTFLQSLCALVTWKVLLMTSCLQFWIRKSTTNYKILPWKMRNVEDFILASQFEAAYCQCLCLNVSGK